MFLEITGDQWIKIINDIGGVVVICFALFILACKS